MHLSSYHAAPVDPLRVAQAEARAAQAACRRAEQQLDEMKDAYRQAGDREHVLELRHERTVRENDVLRSEAKERFALCEALDIENRRLDQENASLYNALGRTGTRFDRLRRALRSHGLDAEAIDKIEFESDPRPRNRQKQRRRGH